MLFITLLSTSSILTTLLFLSLSHPFMLSITVMLQAINIGLMMYLEKWNSWFSYLLFLIFLSGMMIIFIYVSSLASNEKFNKISLMNIFFMSMSTLIIFILSLIFLSKSYMDSSFLNIMSSVSSEIYKTYQITMSSFTSIMIIYLLLVLIVVVNILKKAKAPLRSSK